VKKLLVRVEVPIVDNGYDVWGYTLGIGTVVKVIKEGLEKTIINYYTDELEMDIEIEVPNEILGEIK
jgi:hypothetical protein